MKMAGVLQNKAIKNKSIDEVITLEEKAALKAVSKIIK